MVAAKQTKALREGANVMLIVVCDFDRVEKGIDVCRGGNFCWAGGAAGSHGVLRLRSAGASLRSGRQASLG